MPKILIPDPVASALSQASPVAVGVSGGKDSCAVAFAVAEHLGPDYPGPKILIHSDLGVVEWKDSLPTCQRLADRFGWELVVVRRQAGDMMDRWEQRWRNNLTRYEILECVKVILPTRELYGLFLQSDFWRDMAGRCKGRAGNCCQRCHRLLVPLNAHHLRYTENWFDVCLDDLLAVCDACHEALHCLPHRPSPWDDAPRIIYMPDKELPPQPILVFGTPKRGGRGKKRKRGRGKTRWPKGTRFYSQKPRQPHWVNRGSSTN